MRLSSNTQRQSFSVRFIALTTTALLSASTLAGCSLDIFNKKESEQNEHNYSVPEKPETKDSVVPVILVLDASSSMLETESDGTRMDAAKSASAELLGSLEDGTPLSIVTFGDQVPQAVGDESKEGLARACDDVTTWVKLAPNSVSSAESVVRDLVPKGYTPLAKALHEAEGQLPSKDQPATIVLLSDGEDTCDGQPVDVARKIKEMYPKSIINTVGFKTDSQQLREIAEAGGGSFVTAKNVHQLTSRLSAARSGTTINSKLSENGIYGVSIGMSIDEIRSRGKLGKSFPALSDAREESGRLVIVWRNCEWYFDKDGKLVAIGLANGAATIDGLKVGDQLDELAKVLGEPKLKAQEDGDIFAAYYDAGNGLTWKATYMMEMPDFYAKTLSIELCGCKVPDASGAKENMKKEAKASPKAEAGSGFDAQGRPIITLDAIGPFRLGDDVSALQGGGAVEGEQFEACRSWDLPENFAQEMRIDTRDGRIIRAAHGTLRGEVGKAGVTDRGITIGSTAGEFRKAYPEATGGTNFYRSPGLWRMYVESDKGHTLVVSFVKDGYTSSDSEVMPDDAKLVVMLLTAGNGPGGNEIGFMNGDGDCSFSDPWTNTVF